MNTYDNANIRGLYAITDHDLLGNELIASVTAAIHGGAGIVQYRDKSCDHQRRLQEARALLQICRQKQVPLLINDDVELALAINADGVHLGQQDSSLISARERLGTHAIIGVTCHNRLDLAQQAAAQGANYLAFGAIYPSSSKPEASHCSLELLGQAKAQFDLPIVAIGGITIDNIAPVIAAGADACAVITNLWRNVDVYQQAKAFTQEFSAT